MIRLATGGYFGSAPLLLFTFFVLLRLRGVLASQAFWLPFRGLVWPAFLGAALSVPLGVFSELGSFEAAFVATTPWLNLAVVPNIVSEVVAELSSEASSI